MIYIEYHPDSFAPTNRIESNHSIRWVMDYSRTLRETYKVNSPDQQSLMGASAKAIGLILTTNW